MFWNEEKADLPRGIGWGIPLYICLRFMISTICTSIDIQSILSTKSNYDFECIDASSSEKSESGCSGSPLILLDRHCINSVTWMLNIYAKLQTSSPNRSSSISKMKRNEHLPGELPQGFPSHIWFYMSLSYKLIRSIIPLQSWVDAKMKRDLEDFPLHIWCLVISAICTRNVIHTVKRENL